MRRFRKPLYRQRYRGFESPLLYFFSEQLSVSSEQSVCSLTDNCSLLTDPRELAEWSIAAVLKTADCNRSGGSNPSLSTKTPISGLEMGVLFLRRKIKEPYQEGLEWR